MPTWGDVGAGLNPLKTLHEEASSKIITLRNASKQPRGWFLCGWQNNPTWEWMFHPFCLYSLSISRSFKRVRAGETSILYTVYIYICILRKMFCLTLGIIKITIKWIRMAFFGPTILPFQGEIQFVPLVSVVRKAAEARQNDLDRKLAQKDLDREKTLGNVDFARKATAYVHTHIYTHTYIYTHISYM